MLQTRMNLDADKVVELSTIIQDRILKSPIWPKSGKIGLYYPIKNEVRTHTLFQKALESGLQVYFPRVEQGINFYEVNGPEDLQKGSWGISEPKLDCDVLDEDESLELLIIPGIAFTKTCYRIGYGKQFYDKFISENIKETPTIGLSYEFQIVESFPVDPWDQTVYGVMTEKTFFSRDINNKLS